MHDECSTLLLNVATPAESHTTIINNSLQIAVIVYMHHHLNFSSASNNCSELVHATDL